MYLNLSIFRFYLACSVVVYHLFNGGAPQAGTQAVFLFFLVSGFLVVKLLEESYKGRYKEFVINRFLRIFPLYFFALFIGVLTAFFLPEESLHINRVFQLPVHLDGWFDNIFIFDLYGAPQRLVPVAWSLNTELSFYITFLIISFLSFKIRVFLLLAFIPLPFIFVHFNSHFYGHYFGSGIAFALGALYYYFRDQIRFPLVIQYLALAGLPIVMFVLPFIYKFRGESLNDGGWVLHIAVLVITLVLFELLLNQSENKVYKKSAEFLGMLSYPVFLLHWPSSVLTLYLFSVEKNSFTHFFIAFLITIFLSLISYHIVERPIMAYRTKIRGFERS